MTNKAIVACALVFAACYAWMTEQVTTLPFGDPLGPKAFPRILTVALIGAVLLLICEIKFSKAGAGGSSATADAATDPPAGRWVVAATIAFTALYFFLFEPVGFVLSSTAYLYAMTTYFNPGKHVGNALVSLLFPITCYLLFNHLLGAQLARGILPL